MKATGLIILFLLSVYSGIYAQNKKAVQPTLNYTGDVISNFSGGEKRTLQYMGVLNAGLQVDTDLAGWWKGGVFNVEVLSTHGKGISTTTLYDFQGICGIEAGNHALLAWELWYYQQIGKFAIRGGLMNINSDFMSQPFTDAFSGGSYAVFPTLSLNYSLPNYPTAGFGLSFSYRFNKNWQALTSLFNGRVSDIDANNRFAMDWRLNPRKDGFLSISEVKYISDSTQFPAHIFGVGVVFHNKDFSSIQKSDKSYKNNYALYAFGEHDFYQDKNRTAGVFLQGSYAVKNRNIAYAYSAIGLVANGFFSRSHTDIAGMGLTRLYYQSSENNEIKNRVENTIEVFIKYSLNKYLTIKPTFYTIISHPNPVVTAAMIEFGITIF